MNTPQILTEPAVLALLRQEHTRLSAKTEELWQKLKVAKEEMAPYKLAHDKILNEWLDVHRLTESLAIIIKAKEQPGMSTATAARPS
jgi:hypothetical protein